MRTGAVKTIYLYLLRIGMYLQVQDHATFKTLLLLDWYGPVLVHLNFKAEQVVTETSYVHSYFCVPKNFQFSNRINWIG